ncbi:hypothetical protein RNJ44_03234 [Nakaseomyces bracarensis]|uniref:Sugar phosphate transporter domain-containing protein n=1 Tax=Nakaseomyces bracarensis TaxID=273131 RepID=A0ABR4NZ62_9SACH
MLHKLPSSIQTNIHIITLCLCWYAISSLASQVTKQILTICPLPLFLGEFQFLYTALLAAVSCSLAYRYKVIYNLFPEGTFPKYYSTFHDHECERNEDIKNAIVMPSKHIIMTVLPLSFFQFVGKYFGHTATALVPVSTVASVKTLSPVFIVIFQRFLGMATVNLNFKILGSLSALIFGVWIIVIEDSKQKAFIKQQKKMINTDNRSNSSNYGIICAIISMFIFVMQNIYGKKVFTYKRNHEVTMIKKKKSFYKLENNSSELPIYSESKTLSPKTTKYDKLTLMIYISLVGFCLSFFWFMTMEFPVVWRYINGYETQSDGKALPISTIPWGLCLINGTFHFMQAMITFHLMGEISTLTYSIANLMKRIAIISVSWIFAGFQVTMLQVFGLLLNAVGLFLYERCNSSQKKKTLS